MNIKLYQSTVPWRFTFYLLTFSAAFMTWISLFNGLKYQGHFILEVIICGSAMAFLYFARYSMNQENELVFSIAQTELINYGRVINEVPGRRFNIIETTSGKVVFDN
mgnify:CR=1 FL=1